MPTREPDTNPAPGPRCAPLGRSRSCNAVGELPFVRATLAVAQAANRGKPCPYEFAKLKKQRPLDERGFCFFGDVYNAGSQLIDDYKIQGSLWRVLNTQILRHISASECDCLPEHERPW